MSTHPRMRAGPSCARAHTASLAYWYRCGPAHSRLPNREAAGATLAPAASLSRLELDRVADVAEDRRDLAAQEDEGDDRDDCDEREDQRVLRESLAFLVAAKRCEELLNERHLAMPPDE